MVNRLVRLVAVLFCMVVIFSGCGGREKEPDGLRAQDLEFEANGKVFTLNSDVKPLLAELGEGYTFSEAPSCVYEGTDKTYEYSGISIYTYPLNGKDLIDEIVLTGEGYKTKKGIGIGSSLSDITKAYGEKYQDEGGVITYKLDPEDLKSPCLYFVMEEGRAASISYYSASNIKE